MRTAALSKTKAASRPSKKLASIATKSLACAAWLLTSATVAAKPAAPDARMGPIESYLMDRTQEIALARSAAPASISRHATVLVFTRKGYETAVKGTNGFLCIVNRSFVGASDAPERWNPKIRAAECQNPQAARSVAPFAILRTAMLLAGRSDAEIIARIQSAVRTREIPPLESGAMSYMMSKTAYLTDQGDHRMPHLMFFVAVTKDADWGANAADTPVIGGSYWFYTPGHHAETAKLPPLSVFIVPVTRWSDGTPSMAHRM